MKLNNHKNGFTLIELLIVTVVIVTLMGVVFRLAGMGGSNRAKAITIDRLQKLENALSGYYAAYGCYPPVPLQGRSRSIYKKINEYGVQESGDSETGSKDLEQPQTMAQIIAACRAQPLGVSWPAVSDGEDGETVAEFCKSCQGEAQGPYGKSFRPLTSASGGLKVDEINWRGTGTSGKGVQLFEFGLMSFLFPRYLFMLDGKLDQFYDYEKNGRPHGQWAANNQLPCRLDTGDRFESWKKMRDLLGNSGGNAQNEAGMISNITSQAVCARWMPNFKGIVTTADMPRYRFFYGVDVLDPDRRYFQIKSPISPPSYLKGNSGGDGGLLWGSRLRVFNSSGYSGSGGGSAHLLMCMTVQDGWGNEFFYYSEPPYQSYRLWSSGPDGMTFPPWYDLDQFTGKDLNMIHKFISDDIVHLSN